MKQSCVSMGYFCRRIWNEANAAVGLVLVVSRFVTYNTGQHLGNAPCIDDSPVCVHQHLSISLERFEAVGVRQNCLAQEGTLMRLW